MKFRTHSLTHDQAPTVPAAAVAGTTATTAPPVQHLRAVLGRFRVSATTSPNLR